jgi:outer membrane immunogenic protein
MFDQVGTPKMKKIALAAAAISMMFAGAASAADMAPRYAKAPPPVVPIFSWTGFYIGVNAGGGWNERTGDHYCITPGGVVAGAGCSVSLPGTVEASGALAGAQVGYNWQAGNIVFGGEADIQWSGIRESSAFNLACCLPVVAPPGFAATTSQDLRWFGTARGRLGFVVGERGLLYGTAGLIYGEQAVSFSALSPGANYAAASSEIRTGWIAGAGFEYAFTNNLSGKVEAMYYDMGSERIAFLNPGTGFTLNANFDYTGVIARAGLNWKFGGPVVARY